MRCSSARRPAPQRGNSRPHLSAAAAALAAADVDATLYLAARTAASAAAALERPAASARSLQGVIAQFNTSECQVRSRCLSPVSPGASVAGARSSALLLLPFWQNPCSEGVRRLWRIYAASRNACDMKHVLKGGDSLLSTCMLG